MDLITSLTSQVVHKALDGLALRHKTIASNLANVDTPGFRRRDVQFEGLLKNALRESGQTPGGVADSETMALRVSRPEHISNVRRFDSVEGIQPEVTEMQDFEYRTDGNSVDVETEMAQLARNTQRYIALSSLESRSFKSLRGIISGGGGA